MILPEKKLEELREALQASKRPMFIYDDDPDGLCSFLLLYKSVNAGRGMILKTTSRLTEQWLRKVEEYSPDSVFILDIPVVEQEFIDGTNLPVYWIDHHTPVERSKIKYYNPREQQSDAYIPTSRICYEIVKQNIWIAMVGCIADWHIPDFAEEFAEKYPKLFERKINSPADALYDSPVGRLARIFSFILKGKTSDVFSCIKTLTRIESPEEILNGSTPQGKFILKRFEKVNEKYESLLASAMKTMPKDDVWVFRYDEDQWSFTSELSGELAHNAQKKLILVCRERGGEYKCSLRSREKPVLPLLQKALDGIEGYGGGHEYACGAVIKSHDFERFVERLKEGY